GHVLRHAVHDRQLGLPHPRVLVHAGALSILAPLHGTGQRHANQGCDIPLQGRRRLDSSHGP
ncbi:unnamed protein product, partial [Prorocentrum cordatum]